MKVHILVEGPSDRVFLEGWASRFLRAHELQPHPHQGKGKLPSRKRWGKAPDRNNRSLLHQLPAKLRAWNSSLDPQEHRVVVLLDADTDDIGKLRQEVEAAATELAPRLQVLVALAVEETEAFYLGDLAALKAVWPQADMEKARAYEPDSVCGTAELFGKIVGDGGLNKVDWASRISPRLTTKPAESRSPSFRRMCQDLQALLKPVATSAGRKRRYVHRAKPRREAPSRR